MREKIINRAKNNFGLILVAAFYLGMTLYRFISQGLINWDEAYFVVTVNTFANIIRAVLAHPFGFFGDSHFFQPLLSGYNNVYTAARPSYIIAAVFTNLFLNAGIFATKIISLLSGLAAIVFFYKLLHFYGLGKKTRVAATFFLAASPLFIIYSRLGLSQIFSAAFFLISWYYLLKFQESARSRDLTTAALSLSALATSHYNSFPVVALLFAAGGLIIFQKRLGWKKYLAFIFYFLLFPAVWEIITRVGALVASAKHALDPAKGIAILSYSAEIIQQFKKAGAGSGFSTDQLFYYFSLLASTEGIIFCLLSLAGIAIAILNFKKIKYWLFLAIPLVYLAIFSAVPFKFPRNIIIILPGLYVFAALGLKLASRLAAPRFSPRGKNIILAAFILLVIALNAGQYKNILNIRTNFAEIAGFIKTNYGQDDIVIFSNSAPIWRSYLPGYKAEAFAKVSDPAYALPGKKIIFIDDYFSAVKGGQWIPDSFSAKQLLATETNIFQVKPVVLDFIYQGEDRDKKMFAANQSGPIRIYELIPR
ncbi:MAG: glycosyltransferase family 39 protein [Patescibacteria group bacterium]|nr:glycosyltransferase family 39 protein [Patescibacteria group bacterium]